MPWFASPLMVPLLACSVEFLSTYIAVVELICWTAPLFLFHLRFHLLLSLSFLSVKFRLFFHIGRKFSLQLFLVRMISFLMPCLSKASGECCVALPTYKSIDSTPLLLNRLAGRLPKLVLLWYDLFIFTIELKYMKTYIWLIIGFCFIF